MTEEYTPTTEVVMHALAYPRERLGEPRPISREAAERWLNQVKAEAWDEAREAFVKRGTPGLHDNKYRKER